MPEAEPSPITPKPGAPGTPQVVDIMPETPRLGLDDRFTFRCDPGMDCFGRCCQDVSILLTPYDALRMKHALRIDSTEFMEKYASVMSSTDKKVPVVFLKMDPGTLKCQLVGSQGCAVYNHRPWACRMYPLGMAEPTSTNADAHRFFFTVKEELCHGHGQGEERTVRDFVASQGVEPYDAAQVSFRQLLAAMDEKKEPLTAEQSAMYYMALYDLDRFRRFVFETRFLDCFDVDEARVEAIRSDDEELLEFAVDWLAFSLFQQRRMRLKKTAQVRRAPQSA
jgi:hypothetical protein